jgi:hypothetical protein
MFNVAGTITFWSQIDIASAYITPALQAALGGGILIRSSGGSGHPMMGLMFTSLQ